MAPAATHCNEQTHERHVGRDRADEEDECQDGPPDQPQAETLVEVDGGGERGLKGRNDAVSRAVEVTKAEEEGTVERKRDKGERVTNDPLEDRGDVHADTAGEEERAGQDDRSGRRVGTPEAEQVA